MPRKNKFGRPPKRTGTQRTHLLHVYLSDGEKRRLYAAASLLDMSVSAYCRKLILPTTDQRLAKNSMRKKTNTIIQSVRTQRVLEKLKHKPK